MSITTSKKNAKLKGSTKKLSPNSLSTLVLGLRFYDLIQAQIYSEKEEEAHI